MTALCQCEVCNRLRARGEVGFAGVSISKTAHVLASEIEARAPVKPLVLKSVDVQEVPTQEQVRVIVHAEVMRLFDEVFCEAVGEAVGNVVRDVKADIESATFRFAGPWTEGKSYRTNDVVGHGGSCFICVADTGTKPGTSAAWSPLAIRGRDGKDGAALEPPVVARTARSHR